MSVSISYQADSAAPVEFEKRMMTLLMEQARFEKLPFRSAHTPAYDDNDD
jgi:hypothetical protein